MNHETRRRATLVAHAGPASRAIMAAAAVLSVLLTFMPVNAAQSGEAGHAQRIVTIGGSLTEIVHALGEQGRLAGRDSTSVYPPEAMALPDVGYMRALSPEGVLSIKPDLIVMLEGSGPPEAVNVLRNAGIDFVEVPERFDAAGIAAKIRAVGTALGVEDRAAALEARVTADLEAAREASGESGRKAMFILSMQGGNILASGSGTAADGIIVMAGARNALTGFDGYKPVNAEAVVEAAPDVIVMMDRGGDHGTTAEELFAHPAIALTPAAKGRRLVRMDGTLLLGFGPRTAEAVRELAGRIGKGDPAAPRASTQ